MAVAMTLTNARSFMCPPDSPSDGGRLRPAGRSGQGESSGGSCGDGQDYDAKGGAMAKTHFRPPLFRFLEELRRHNDRAWFAENKERFERDVRDPMLAFVGDLAAPLAKISRFV